MRHSLLILLLCWGDVLARDPFRPVAASLCQAAVAPLTGWRLQGIAGRETRYQAWLLTPQGERVTLGSDTPFPLTPWQLVAITSRSLTLAVPASCHAQRTTFYLKGYAHVKDSDPAPHQQPAAGLRR